eukprot:7560211-Pyramimonas_sp.AAC.2
MEDVLGRGSGSQVPGPLSTGYRGFTRRRPRETFATLRRWSKSASKESPVQLVPDTEEGQAEIAPGQGASQDEQR